MPAKELSDDELIHDGRRLARERQGRRLVSRPDGGRSILADPRLPAMQRTLNLKIKFRESFRPFAPAVLAERLTDYFELQQPSPYMLIVAPVKSELRIGANHEQSGGRDLTERLEAARSTIPAVTHVDYSARVQSVSAEENPRFHRLLQEFETRTGCAVLVNTSFNVRGEPPICTPTDALRCFLRTEIDDLVIGNFLLSKTDVTQTQPRESPAASPPIDARPAGTKESPRTLRRFGRLLAAIMITSFRWMPTCPTIRRISLHSSRKHRSRTS
jgi:hypothetical protein